MINLLNDIYGRIQSPVFEGLSNQYLSNIYYYINANAWAESPFETTLCDSDIDYDGSIECIISNKIYYAIIEMDGGRLAFPSFDTPNPYKIVDAGAIS